MEGGGYNLEIPAIPQFLVEPKNYFSSADPHYTKTKGIKYSEYLEYVYMLKFQTKGLVLFKYF